MTEFKYFVNNKIKTWDQTVVYIDAESKEDADKQITTAIEEDGYIDGESYEVIYESIELMNPSENNMDSTVEIYDENSKMIYQNGN